MEFRKFQSIPNLEDAKEKQSLDYLLARMIRGWVVTEKVDGANISFHCDRHGVSIATRERVLDSSDSFCDVHNQYEQVRPFIERVVAWMQNDAPKELDQVSIYGEYYGSRVMNRIGYGTQYAFRFFHILYLYENGEEVWLPFISVKGILESFGVEHLLVPVLATVETFDEACDIANNGVSRLGGTDKMEGVVISPLDTRPRSRDGKFMFKNKNPEFSEKSKPRERTQEEKDRNAYLQDMRTSFRGYCTESRMYSVCSKLGRPSGSKDAGKYLGAFIADAWSDFSQDNPDIGELSKGEMKFVTNFGGEGFKLFQSVSQKLQEGSYG